jgi:hypothetical protein|tara:strand:- start:178 stop:372 length:195 start_codon:yes stop_codon:yes gene_type:complete
MVKKDEALHKIESHEKLCRIMQKQTHDKIHSIETQIQRIESILLVTTGALISGMIYLIFNLISK